MADAPPAPPAPPTVLGRLLAASDPAARDASWSDFASSYSKLILHVARSAGGDRDSAMDRYAYILDQLQRDDYRRLRTYVADGRSAFSTWLVVVAQRMCLDHRRQRYGRLRSTEEQPAAQEEEWRARRRLVDLISAEVDLDTLADQRVGDSETDVRLADIYGALASALATLEPRDRLLIKLRFEDGLPMPEIAEQLGLPTRFHAYRRLTEVLGVLRRALERGGIGESTP